MTEYNTNIPILIVVCGATGTGKSGLAIALSNRLAHAKRLNSVILSADSRQVYREFNIGTAKPSLADQQQVPHYLIDICDPTETLTLAEYQQQAQKLIEGLGKAEGRGQKAEEIGSRGAGEQGSRGAGGTGNREQGTGKILHSQLFTLNSQLPPPTPLPLLVGGTGLYIRSVTRGLVIPRVPPQAELRVQLQQLGQKHCYALLEQVDPASALKIHPRDQVRTVRSLEVFYTTGRPLSEQQGEEPPKYPILQIGLDCQNTEALRSRIERRTEQMVAMGFVDEVATLRQKYGAELPLLNTLGYAEFKQHLTGKLSLTEAKQLTVLHTRQFAKRQRTWFYADPSIHWFDADAPDLEEQVWQEVNAFLKSVG